MKNFNQAYNKFHQFQIQNLLNNKYNNKWIMILVFKKKTILLVFNLKNKKNRQIKMKILIKSTLQF